MRSNSGFSILEIMVVIGILAILAGIAMPNFLNWREDAQLGRAAQDLYGIFQKAKITAARSNQYCTVAFSHTADGTYYDYVIFVDGNRNLIWNAGEHVISGGFWSNYGTVEPDSDFAFGTGIGFPGLAVAFAPDGLPRNAANNLNSGSVYLRTNKNNKLAVSINLAGYIQIH